MDLGLTLVQTGGQAHKQSGRWAGRQAGRPCKHVRQADAKVRQARQGKARQSREGKAKQGKLLLAGWGADSYQSTADRATSILQATTCYPLSLR